VHSSRFAYGSTHGRACQSRGRFQLRTTRPEDDVGERTVKSVTRSLFQLAAAAEGGINVIDNLCTHLSIEVGELRAAVETAVGDTYKVVLDKIGEKLKTFLVPLIGLVGVVAATKSTPGDLLDAKLMQLQVQMTELKLTVSRSQGVGFLEDHAHELPQEELERQGCRSVLFGG
jgi:hypothetical protein